MERPQIDNLMHLNVPKLYTSFAMSFVFSAATPSSVFKWTGLHTFLSPWQACVAHTDRLDEGEYYLFGEFVVKKKWVVHSHHSLWNEVMMETRHPRPLWRSWSILWLYWCFPREMFGFWKCAKQAFLKEEQKNIMCRFAVGTQDILYKHWVWGVESREGTCVCSKLEAL